MIQLATASATKGERRQLMAVCTSTPRKSKSYYDQRRQLDEILCSSSSLTPSPKPEIKSEVLTKLAAEESNVETPLTTLPLPPPSKLVAQRRRSTQYKRRLSRRLPRLRPESSSARSSADVKTPLEMGSSEVVEVLQRLRKQRVKRMRSGRPSIYIRGNAFITSRTPNRAALRQLSRAKAHKQRTEHFNKLRVFSDKTTTDGDVTASDVYNNNNNKDFVSNKQPDPGKTLIVLEQQDLVNTQDLLAFDEHLVSQQNAQLLCNYDLEVDELHTDSVDFERLLKRTTSQAPFEVKRIHFDVQHSTSSISTLSSMHSHSTEGVDVGVPSMTVAACSTRLQPSCYEGAAQRSHPSRTIYGGSVIFNRRIPNISSTHVRKSSIYVKNNDASAAGDIILVTDQTITLADLAKMWRQMNTAARLMVAFATFASIGTVAVIINLLMRLR